LLTGPTENRFIMADPRPRQPIDRSPHRRIRRQLVDTVGLIKVAMPVASDRHQPGAAAGDAQHSLSTLPTEQGFVVGDPRPGQPVRRSPHRGIALAHLEWSVESDSHEARASNGHAEHLLFTRPTENGFVVGDPRPGETVASASSNVCSTSA
jgi:hypothetical protein